MIRFSCPHCSRDYVLADALARLPLLCKQCGQRLEVPDPQPEPPPTPPPPPPPPPPQATAKSGVRIPKLPPPAPKPEAHAPGSPQSPVAPAPDSLEPDFLSKDTLDKLDVPQEPSSPPGQAWGAPAQPKTTVQESEGHNAPASPGAPSRKLLSIVVDVVVGLILIGLGVLVGEFATRKSTREILEGASGPKFPSVDLLVWLGGPVLLVLIYVWLGTRGWTVGGWLRRRSAA